MSGESLAGRNLISLLDFNAEECLRVIELAGEVKANPSHYADALSGDPGRPYTDPAAKPSRRRR